LQKYTGIPEIDSEKHLKSHWNLKGVHAMGRKKVIVLDSKGQEVVDEEIRRNTLAAIRKVKKPRKPETEAHIRASRKRLIEEAKGEPYIKAIKWNLGMHLTNDICGQLASQDLYGLGPGVYPPHAYPEIPHDNCHCWDEEIIDHDYFKRPIPKDIIEKVKKDPKYPEFKKWAEEWLKRIKE
jgi:hypothetical protein